MGAVATQSQNMALSLEQVLIGGDLAKLSAAQRVEYYNRVCESIGLNPLTQPFAYITLNNKLTLYALRACTDQLRSVHGVSVEETSETERDGVFIVTAKVRNRDGRTDISRGAVNITGLKGEALANALMKAETKAKRRATLSICGLGMLDETEVETIPNAKVETVPPQTKAALTPPPAPAPLSDAEERALDRQSFREMRGEVDIDNADEDNGARDGLVSPTSESDRAATWAKKSILTVQGFSTREAFDAWYTEAVRGAIKRLGDHDKELQEKLTQEVLDALDRWNPIGA